MLKLRKLELRMSLWVLVVKTSTVKVPRLNCIMEIQNMTVGTGANKAWFNIHEARLNYIITLSDPYVIIDQLVDDRNREETLWWNFWIYGEFQQEGVASVEMPDQVGHDGEILRSAQNDNRGWENGNEYTIPL